MQWSLTFSSIRTIGTSIGVLVLISFPASAQLSITPGDVNEDGKVDIQDITFVANHWLNGYGPGDANNDGSVNISDITLIANNWLKTGPTQAQVIASLPVPPDSAYASGLNAHQLSQIGVTASVAAAGNYGEGVTIGFVDEGIWVNDPQFAGRISPKSTCVFTEPTTVDIGCSTHYRTGLTYNPNRTIDPEPGDSHGQTVTSVAAGANPSQIGVAPKATIDLIKLLDWNVPVGIQLAADSGASIISVSVQQALNNRDAINYAAGKGATVVIAAGNDGVPYFYFGGLYGFTQQALSHVIVVGAVNSSNGAKENISNIPDSNFIGTTGTQTLVVVNPDGTYSPLPHGLTSLPIIAINTSTGPIVTLQSIWLMAPDTVSGVGGGTSFSAPMVAGALALVDSRWPVLLQNGTAPAVLFASATQIGDPALYGNGLLNLQAAFQPIGGLNALTGGGGSVPLAQVTGQVQTGGALGSMGKLSSALSSYTAFDSFHRDFSVDLSGMITKRSSASSAAQAVTAPQPRVNATHFADGSSLSFGNQEVVSNGVDQPMGKSANPNWFVSFSDMSGRTVAAGYGFPAQASFAEAMWGNESAASLQSGGLGIANSLSSIAQGGMFTAFGADVGKETRVAFAWSESQSVDPIMGASWTAPVANAFSASITTHLTEGWQVGATFGSLNEKSGLLGTTYDSKGPLSLGSENRTVSVGLSSALRLSGRTDVLVEASIAKSAGANGSGLIENISPLYARSMGASLVEQDAINDGDQIEFTVKSPLQVFKGSASLVTASVDPNGNPVISSQSVSLKPGGSELYLGVAYHAPVRGSFKWNASIMARRDADNVAGNTDILGLLSASLTF